MVVFLVYLLGVLAIHFRGWGFRGNFPGREGESFAHAFTIHFRGSAGLVFLKKISGSAGESVARAVAIHFRGWGLGFLGKTSLGEP